MLGSSVGPTYANTGYETIGYLTYTLLDSTESPMKKLVVMFAVTVVDGEWRIRTEPLTAIKDGIAHYDSWTDANDYVCAVTAFAAASSASDSRFQALRSGLLQGRAETVDFRSGTLDRLIAASSNTHGAAGSSPSAVFRPANQPPPTNRLGNVAVARLTPGNHPLPDPSFATILWFAFTPPIIRTNDASTLLPQTWDDGSVPNTRYRRAKWQQLPDAPYLISSADYSWTGSELLPNGSMRAIDLSGVSDPHALSAHYVVEATTNTGSHVLPTKFTLTRFRPRQAAGGRQRVSSTISATVVDVKRVTPQNPSAASLPGLTFVTDYRLSSGALRGAPVGYAVRSNRLPDIEELAKSGSYTHALATSRMAHPSGYKRAVLIGCLLIPALLIIVWRYGVLKR